MSMLQNLLFWVLGSINCMEVADGLAEMSQYLEKVLNVLYWHANVRLHTKNKKWHHLIHLFQMQLRV